MESSGIKRSFESSETPDSDGSPTKKRRVETPSLVKDSTSLLDIINDANETDLKMTLKVLSAENPETASRVKRMLLIKKEKRLMEEEKAQKTIKKNLTQEKDNTIGRRISWSPIGLL
jgi:hypothetical protein